MNFLTHKQLANTLVCSVATDALVLKHQTLSIHGTDQVYIVLDQLLTNVLYLQ